MQCLKNQTSIEAVDKLLQKINENIDTASGTGVFLTGDPDSLPSPYKKVFVENIKYAECLQRGVYCFAFKWIPHAELSYEQLKLIDCTNKKCSDDNPHGTCNGSCLCIKNNPLPNGQECV